jgi:choline monooxygenase
MFIHQHQLEYLLRSEDYHSEEQFRTEIDRLFLPAWHLVCTKAELPRDGDFLTMDLFDRPLLVRNFGGEYFAFENVCAHRHCLLTTLPRGNSPKLRCQYHGWEYDQHGRTGRIPDAKCFRPWDRENARLKTYRLESLGDLLFVSLAQEGPSLREYFGPHYDAFAPFYTTPEWRLKHVWEYDCPSNWKVPAENTLESYHIPCLHPSSFGGLYPSEPASEHELDPRYTLLRYDSSEDPKVRIWQTRFTRWLGGTPTSIYVHCHVHPHLIFVSTDLFAYALMYIPLSPRLTRLRIRMFAFRGTKRAPWAWLLAKFTAALGQWTMKRIQLEDLAIFADQQRGLEVSPHRGVIGTREERIYVFQQYIQQTCGTEPRTNDRRSETPPGASERR